MNILTIILATLLDIVPGGDARIEQLQKRDSILIADQVRYEIVIEGLEKDSRIALPDFSQASNDTLTLVRGWQLDTLSGGKPVRSRNAKAAEKILRKPFDVRASIILAPFEEGKYELPDIPVVRNIKDKYDTLIFKGVEMEVKTMPVDTAPFQIHDIKGQIRYPLTFKEVLPWLLGFYLLAVLIIGLVCLILSRKRKDEASYYKEPAYIVALRGLDKYRGDRYWAPEKQKTMYSGITDTLRTYIESRFDVNAEEMTTAEIFESLKSEADLTPELYAEVKDLFELSDFVKFAKHTASDEENARAIPTAVRFVTSTYQTQLDAEADQTEKEEEG